MNFCFVADVTGDVIANDEFSEHKWVATARDLDCPLNVKDLVDIARDPDTQAKLRKIGFEPIGKDAAAFQEFFRGDVKKWTDFVKDRGLKETQ